MARGASKPRKQRRSSLRADPPPCTLRFCNQRPDAVRVLWLEEDEEGGGGEEREYAQLEPGVSTGAQAACMAAKPTARHGCGTHHHPGSLPSAVLLQPRHVCGPRLAPAQRRRRRPAGRVRGCEWRRSWAAADRLHVPVQHEPSLMPCLTTACLPACPLAGTWRRGTPPSCCRQAAAPAFSQACTARRSPRRWRTRGGAPTASGAWPAASPSLPLTSCARRRWLRLRAS